MTLQDALRKEIEIKYLRVLVEVIKAGGLEPVDARESAREFLWMLPFEDFEDMKVKIQKFVEIYPELKPVEIFVLQKEEELKTKNVLEKMRDYMNDNKIDQALQMGKTV